jgi:hypothetical protein
LKMVFELNGDLQRAADSKPEDQDYTNLSVLAGHYAERLDKLSASLEKIGTVCEQSDNRSAVSSHKSGALDRTKTARDKAQALQDKSLKIKGGDKSDATGEIKDLQSALANLKSTIDDVLKDHQARLKQLQSDYKDAHEKFVSLAEESDSDIKKERENWKALQEKCNELSDSIDREEAAVSLTDLWTRYNRAAEAYRSAYGERGLNRLTPAELDRISVDFARADQNLFEFRLGAIKTLLEHREKEKDAAAAYEKSLDEFLTLMKDKELPAAQDLEKKTKTLEDLRKEFNPQD